MLEQPFMVIKRDGQNKIVLLPLPYDTKYTVSGTNTKSETILKKDTYVDTLTDSDCYTFCYPSYWYNQTTNEEELIKLAKEWYKEHCFGEETSDGFVITYLGVKFKIEFNLTKVNKTSLATEPAFKIYCIS